MPDNTQSSETVKRYYADSRGMMVNDQRLGFYVELADYSALRERLEEAEKALEAAREVDRLYVSERSATPDPADTKWIMRVNAMNALHSALTPPTPPSTGGAK